MSLKHILITLLAVVIGLAPAPLTAGARNLFIVGDSTASHYGPERWPRMGWGQVLEHFYGDDIRVINLAKSGRSARSYIEEGFFADLEARLGESDVLLVQFSHNDQKKNSPGRYAPAGEVFESYLDEYVSVARRKGATAVLLTPVVRRKFEQGRLVPTHGEYPESIRNLAARSSLPIIDVTRLSAVFTSALGPSASKSVYLHVETEKGVLKDDTHFSERGAFAIAAIVARELDSLGIVERRSSQDRVIHVAKHGGDFARVQDAIDSLDGSRIPTIIMIAAGNYEEKLFLVHDDITLVGAGRDKTRIRSTQLRAHWRETHDDDWGAATLNVKASDITLMNLSVINDFGMVHGDNTHQFAVRLMEGTRFISENSTFIAGGADTVSLWNKQDGMYYHRRAYFEGYTDFVCPRGWSYITDSRFFSRGGGAAIWHDGADDETQKLVIKRSSFDGIEGFILGRRHYDAQFFLVDNHYSERMADTPIFRVTYEDASRNRPNLWGDRYFFSGSVKRGADFNWIKDNLPPALPKITPAFVFGNRWDPEARLAGIKASIAMIEIRDVVY